MQRLKPVPKPISKAVKPEKMGAIAIIGMSGLFPQSDNLKTFWNHLINCDDLITEIPNERLGLASILW